MVNIIEILSAVGFTEEDYLFSVFNTFFLRTFFFISKECTCMILMFYYITWKYLIRIG